MSDTAETLINSPNLPAWKKPQSGNIFPILWLITMDEILWILERSGVKVVAYDSHLVILVPEMFPTVLYGIMDCYLPKRQGYKNPSSAVKWAKITSFVQCSSKLNWKCGCQLWTVLLHHTAVVQPTVLLRGARNVIEPSSIRFEEQRTRTPQYNECPRCTLTPPPIKAYKPVLLIGATVPGADRKRDSGPLWSAYGHPKRSK